MSPFSCLKQTIRSILCAFLDDIIVIRSIPYCTLPPSGAAIAVTSCWPLHEVSPAAVSFASILSFYPLSRQPSGCQVFLLSEDSMSVHESPPPSSLFTASNSMVLEA